MVFKVGDDIGEYGAHFGSVDAVEDLDGGGVFRRAGKTEVKIADAVLELFRHEKMLCHSLAVDNALEAWQPFNIF